MSCDSESVLIIDAGSQYSKLIDRLVRELSVKSVIAPLTISHVEILQQKYKAIIISGGPGSVSINMDVCFDNNIFELGIPVLGICYGMQLMVKNYGGIVETLDRREDAQTIIEIANNCVLYSGLEIEQTVLLTHGDSCTQIPQGFTINATSSKNVAVSISDETKRLFGIQFHPEVNLTIDGRKIMQNFLFKISGISPTYTLTNRLDSYIADIKAAVRPESKIIILTSGGVDSTICSVLLHKILSDYPLYCIFVDHGFLRKNEVEEVNENFTELGIKLITLDESLLFLNASTFSPNYSDDRVIYDEVGPLKMVVHPEYKRNIIGDCFMKLIKSTISNMNIDFRDCILVQGTLRPDLIESASPSISKLAHTIKTHHNDTKLVRILRESGQIMEPFKDLHKDEVRQLATMLGVPNKMIQRQPFPGPGLAIRIICSDGFKTILSDNKYDVTSIAEFISNYASKITNGHNNASKLINDSLSSIDIQHLLNATKHNYYLTATVLPILSVGVQGDCRSYKNVLALSTDSITFDWPNLYVIAQIIPKICTTLNRVVFAFGGKIKAPINYLTTTYLTPAPIALAREADHVVSSILRQEDVTGVSQFPVVVIPIHFDIPLYPPHPSLKRSIVLRPFISTDFMTGIPALPQIDIDQDIVMRITNALLKLPTVSRVLYDLSSKPPSTTEWE